jgi:electron transfer flavoprotein alpha subunit
MTNENIPDEAEIRNYSGVWVIMQVDNKSNTPKKVSFELVSEANKLANQLQQNVSAVCLCVSEPKGMRKILGELGCDELLLVENTMLEYYNTEIYTGIR